MPYDIQLIWLGKRFISPFLASMTYFVSTSLSRLLQGWACWRRPLVTLDVIYALDEPYDDLQKTNYILWPYIKGSNINELILKGMSYYSTVSRNLQNGLCTNTQERHFAIFNIWFLNYKLSFDPMHCWTCKLPSMTANRPWLVVYNSRKPPSCPVCKKMS